MFDPEPLGLGCSPYEIRLTQSPSATEYSRIAKILGRSFVGHPARSIRAARCCALREDATQGGPQIDFELPDIQNLLPGILQS